MNIKDFITHYPDANASIMTPGGYVCLTPELSIALLEGQGTTGHPGDPAYAMSISAEELLPQVLCSVHLSKGVWSMLSDYPSEEEKESKEPEYALKVHKELRSRISVSYQNYMEQIESLPADVLIGKAGEIASTKAVYHELLDNSYPVELEEYLLGLDDPLFTLRDKWMQKFLQPMREGITNAMYCFMK